MYDFHQDKARYFHFQYLTSRDHIMPYIQDMVNFDEKLHVLEIGCAEAGVLKAFTEKGHQCTGIELNKDRVMFAQEFMKEEIEQERVCFISKNIYDIDVENDIGHRFDVVILKDVIEHIFDQEVFIARLHEFLKPSGKVFFAFPPWQMPFGGHQQICSSKFLGKLPYFHLLPKSIYKAILKLFKEPHYTIQELLEIKQTGLSIEYFERILKQNQYKIIKKTAFLFNPIYQYKFGIKTRKQSPLIDALPVIRNFFTTGVYYICELDKNTSN